MGRQRLRPAGAENVELAAGSAGRRDSFNTWWQASLQRFERELRPEVAVAEGCRRLAEKGRYAALAVAAAVAEKRPESRAGRGSTCPSRAWIRRSGW